MRKIKTIRTDIANKLDELYYSVQEYILQHQKEKGYIDLQDAGCDKMYYYEYEDGNLVEGVIKGIRVKDGDIQIIGTQIQHPNIVYTEESFARASELYDNQENGGNFGEDEFDWENIEDCWQGISCSASIIFRYTLLSIADSIEQYK